MPPPEVPEGGAARNETHVAVLLWHTNSHYRVGTAVAFCVSGCTCQRQILTPHIKTVFGTQARAWGAAPFAGGCAGSLSGLPAARACRQPLRTHHLPARRPPLPPLQDHLQLLIVSRSKECIVAVKTLPITTTGGCAAACGAAAGRKARAVALYPSQ